VFERLNLTPVRRALAAVRWSAPADLDSRVAEAQRAVEQMSAAGAAT